MNKKILDELLIIHKAQPVGNGYIDIIVKKENYRHFVKDILQNGFIIESISWWEYFDSLDERPVLGMGGPRSKYYSGWFPEISCELDEVQNYLDVNELESSIISIVEKKEFLINDNKKLSFTEYAPLTPGFWLKVPEDWTNNQ